MKNDQISAKLDKLWDKVKPDRRMPDGSKMPNTQWCQGAQWAIQEMRMTLSGGALAEAMQLKIKETEASDE